MKKYQLHIKLIGPSYTAILWICARGIEVCFNIIRRKLSGGKRMKGKLLMPDIYISQAFQQVQGYALSIVGSWCMVNSARQETPGFVDRWALFIRTCSHIVSYSQIFSWKQHCISVHVTVFFIPGLFCFLLVLQVMQIFKDNMQ